MRIDQEWVSLQVLPSISRLLEALFLSFQRERFSEKESGCGGERKAVGGRQRRVNSSLSSVLLCSGKG